MKDDNIDTAMQNDAAEPVKDGINATEERIVEGITVGNNGNATEECVADSEALGDGEYDTDEERVADSEAAENAEYIVGELEKDTPTITPDLLSCMKIYGDTQTFFESIEYGYDFCPPILKMIVDGSAEIEIKKKYILKAIDEVWVDAIEKSMPALDACIRRPAKYIEDNESVLPIELSKHINSRSIKHLAQHTDYIRKIEGDEITPSKILNVYHEETMMTYENKFINTLLNRLYVFVNRRYLQARDNEKDEKRTSLNFTSNFQNGTTKCKMNFSVDLTEEPEETEQISGFTFSKGLWKRVKRLNSVATEYIESSFAKSMGKNFVRPPIMRTNAILKNKDLKQCLDLWVFIESYENIGIEMYIQETAEKPDQEYIKELYSMQALQYLIFRYNVSHEFKTDISAGMSETDTPLKPKFVTDFDKYVSDDYNVYDSVYRKMVPVNQLGNRRKLSEDELKIRAAIAVAISADNYIEQQRIAAEKAERERIAAEEAERARIAAEEEERIRREAEEAERLKREAEEAERMRIEAEAERKRLEKEAEAERRRLEKEAAEEAERARIAAEEAERAKLLIIAAERAKRIAQEEAERQKKFEQSNNDSTHIDDFGDDENLTEEELLVRRKNKYGRKKKKKAKKAAIARGETFVAPNKVSPSKSQKSKQDNGTGK